MVKRFLIAAASFVAFTGMASAQTYYNGASWVNRAEMTKLAMDSAGIPAGGSNCFSDVRNEWFAPYVCAARNRGIINGYADGRFKPANTVSFVEAAAIAVRAEGISVRSDTVWYRPYLEVLTERDALPSSVVNIFHPINRAQVNEMLSDLRNGDDDDDDDSSSGDDFRIDITEEDDPVEEGETIEYEIKISNRSGDDESIEITAFLDDDMEFVSASDDGDEDDDEVTWDDIDIDDDDSETITLKVRLKSGADDGDSVKLRVEAEDAEATETTEVDDDSDDDDDDNEDIEVTITDSESSVEEGDEFHYTIKIENNGNSDEHVDVTAMLDEDVSFVSASDSGDRDGDEVQWDNILVREDSSKSLTLRVKVRSTVDDGDTLRLEVEAGDDEDSETTEVDDDGGSNNDDGDIKVSITDSDTSVEPGDEFTYTIRLENNSDDDERIDVRAELDDETTFVSASESDDHTSSRVDWDDVFIAEDSVKTLTLKVRVKSTADDGDTLVLTVDADGEEEEEETDVEDDNGGSSGSDDVEISITDSDDPVDIGDIVTYRIKLTNNDNDDVHVDLTARLDDGMSYSSSSDNGELIGDDEIEWDNIRIDGDDDRTILLTVRITGDADDGDTLELEVETDDDEDMETTRVDD